MWIDRTKYTQLHDNSFSRRWINLADDRLGTTVAFATDDFFAEKENLIKAGRGIFIDDKYTDRGKWMDGWESRRKRVDGHDYCDISLGARGRITAFDIDTNHFLGNHPPHASVEARDGEGEWKEVLSKAPLKEGQQNLFEIEETQPYDQVRLHIYPDGGVARFRVYGNVEKDWSGPSSDREVDLLAVENGGKAISCNDEFFSQKNNLVMPGRPVNMGDGWETRRRREPGNDWVILTLGTKGKIGRVELDTGHFKGNFPDRFSLEGADMGEVGESCDNPKWQPLLPETKLEADHIHKFDVKDCPAVTHVRLQIYPDGGVGRLRLFGQEA